MVVVIEHASQEGANLGLIVALHRYEHCEDCHETEDAPIPHEDKEHKYESIDNERNGDCESAHEVPD